MHVAGYNLGLIMRLLVSSCTPRELLAGASAQLLALATADGAIFVAATASEAAMLAIICKPEPHG